MWITCYSALFLHLTKIIDLYNSNHLLCNYTISVFSFILAVGVKRKVILTMILSHLKKLELIETNEK